MLLKLIKPTLCLTVFALLSGCHLQRHFFPSHEKEPPLHRCHQSHAFPSAHDEHTSDGYGCAYQNNFALMDAGIHRKKLSPADGKRQSALLETYRTFKDEKPVVDDKLAGVKTQ